jgi:hypothetical protein
MKMEFELTKDEKSAIRRLKRLANDWPDGLWLFSASGTLWVMKTDENGDQAMKEGLGGGFDPGYCVEIINIPNDGGDW